MLKRTKLGGLALAAALLGGICGYVAEAHAVDRAPFPGRPFGDAGPGYGAERQYYGAENIYRPHRGGYARSGGNYRSYGSFVDFGTGNLPTVYMPLGTFQQPSRAGVYPSYGSSSSSFVYLKILGDTIANAATGASTVVRAAPPADDSSNGKVSVSFVGSTKIIHIAAEPSLHKTVQASRVSALEPWSEGWERYCTRTHPDFDPARGTFTDSNGRNRFCTGE